MTDELTIYIPNDLRVRANALAVARGESVSEVVRTALEHYLAELIEEADDVAAAREVEARLLSGEEGTLRWSDFQDERWPTSLS